MLVPATRTCFPTIPHLPQQPIYGVTQFRNSKVSIAQWLPAHHCTIFLLKQLTLRRQN